MAEIFIRIRHEENFAILESIYKVELSKDVEEWDIINMYNTLDKSQRAIDDQLEHFEKKKQAFINTGYYENWDKEVNHEFI